MSRISPNYLPQLNAPIDNILKEILNNDVEYEYTQMNPNELKTSQPFTLSDDVYSSVSDDMHPIWTDNNLNIIDGHHKWVKLLSNNELVIIVKINLEFKDACRLLNKIQDIYEYEQKQGLEEVEMQDAINYYGDDENQFLNALEEDNNNIKYETPNVNQQTIVGYRKDPIKENSSVGNFFTLNPVNGYSKYQIDFDNLLDTNALGVTYKDSQEPVDILAKIWFPHVNFEKISKQYDMPVNNLKNKAIAEKAMKLGFDGVKYGDKLIQGLK